MENLSILNPAVDLGTVDYAYSLELQRKLVNSLRIRKMGDFLLFLEHPPVFTVGRGKKEENYESVKVIETERGGDVTYHGPGQLVVYPIMDLVANGLDDVRKYVHLIEEIIIESLGEFGFEATIGEEPGIWVNERKVASIGMAIRDGIAFHGFAINLSQEAVSGFSKIRACGLEPSKIYFVPVEKNELIDAIFMIISKKVHEFKWVSKENFYLSL